MGTRRLHIERSTSTAHRLVHYDGICGDVHGHNMHWEVEARVDMAESDGDNMPLDLKDVSGLIDEVDHTTLLNEDDPLVHDRTQEGIQVTDAKASVRKLLGEVIWFDGDPTCEVVVKWMAKRIHQLDSVIGVRLTLYETDKYGVETSTGLV